MNHERKTAILALSLIVMNSFAPAGAAMLDPVPTDRGSIEAQLKRYKGQTQFLNPLDYYQHAGDSPKSEQKAGQKGDKRGEQESDIFKVGKPGSKLLFLLNNYRGLQVVSYADGPNQPKLVGRVAPTGNYPDKMYYDQARDRLIVLEALWGEDRAGKSRVLIYDVKKPDAPAITQHFELEGSVADSRIVGDILYVATGANEKGHVHSIKLGDHRLESVQSLELTMPVSYAENMNIVEIEEGGKFKYYLIAILSQSGWGWWDRQSGVEIVDISDNRGKILPIMSVSAKGAVRERSQTQIKNGTLLVTSNYRTGEGESDPMRIAVETFKLPTEKNDVLTDKEAQYRKLHIDRELDKHQGTDREAAYKRLIADTNLGIQGRFVQKGDRLTKLVPDHVITVGDTQGLHANLREVRYEGDHLYVFWVPQNEVDPFDLFDISEPQKEVRYLKRLYFDGWIERAIPMAYQGRKFVLGLGRVVENVDNENNRRSPQVMLFEVLNQGGKAKAVDLAQMTLKGDHVWTNFNEGDRFIEVRDNGNGTGSVMFEAYGAFNGAHHSGGKLIGFDLNAAIQGKPDAVFREGALLAAESSWLRRVFTNPEIAMVNTFSDTSLSAFDVKDIGRSDQLAQAVSTLELARNIRGYAKVGETGIQIVGQGWWSAGDTTLRAVNPREADAEKTSVRAERTLQGSYVAHSVDRRDGALWVATHHVEKEVARYLLHKVGADLNATALVWTQTNEAESGNGRHSPYWRDSSFQFFQGKDGGLMVSVGQKVARVLDNEIVPVSLMGCVTEGDNLVSSEVRIIGDRFFHLRKESVEDPKRAKLTYARHFLAPLKMFKSVAQCELSVNIPGEPFAATDTSVISRDQRVIDVTENKHGNEIYYHVVAESVLTSLKFEAAASVLVDDYDPAHAGYASFQEMGAGRFGVIEAEGNKMTVLSVDADLEFVREKFLLPESFRNGMQLQQVIQDGSQYLGLVTNGRQLQILRWTEQSAKPSLQKLIAVDPLNRGKTADEVLLPTYWSQYWGTEKAHFSSSQKTVEIPLNYFGVQQIQLAQ